MTRTRRELLRDAALTGAVLGLTRTLAAQEGDAPAGKAPLFHISLAEWSLHRALFAGEMAHLEFPGRAGKEFGVEGIEYVNSFFKDKAHDEAYLTELDKRCKDAGVKSLLIMCDGEGDLSDADDAQRTQAVTNHEKWIDAAARLGCHSIRVNAGGPGPRDEVAKRAADSLVRLATYAEPHGLNVIVENHGGISSDGSWVASVMKLADNPRVGTLPDFGNFDMGGGKEYDRYKGVGEMMPYAKAVSAKSHEFDDKGECIETDYHRMLKIVVEAGYHAYLGIEYEGKGLSEPEGILATKRLLERVRAELS